MDYVHLKLKATLAFETSETNYAATERHSPEDLNPQLHRSQNSISSPYLILSPKHK